MENIKITYDFRFPDKTRMSYVIEMDEETLTFIPHQPETPPDWAKLENHKCSHCPLDSKKSPYCPIAANLSHLVEFFKDKVSYDSAVVQVTSAERIYIKKLSLQDGIFSVFGLIMPISGCPYMNFLKPMARFHLPFSTSQETIVRSVSLYLLRQYFVAKAGGKPDYELQQLESRYNNIQKVNEGMIKRLRTIVKKDADVNAVIILHTFADLLGIALTSDLSAFESLFSDEPQKVSR